MAPSLFALFLAGTLTFASPCVLPLIPAYLAALGGGAMAQGRRRLVLSATAFALGMSAVFVALGAAASVAGSRLLAHRDAMLFTSGAVMVLFGLRALGMIRIPLLDREARPALARIRSAGGFGAALLFGAAFAIGWSPCIGPLLASALAYAASHAATPWRGAQLLAVYAAGIALPLVAVAAVADRALGWVRRSASLLPRIERATGALLVGVGVWTGYDSGVVQRAMFDVAEAPCPAEGPEQGCGLSAGPARAAAVADVTGPRLVEFTAQDCPACRRMAPVLARAEAACDGVGERTYRADVGTAQGLALARTFGVVGTPTLVVIGQDDVERSRLVGEQPIERVKAAIESAFGTRCQGEGQRAPSG